jgi:hypothetical protein
VDTKAELSDSPDPTAEVFRFLSRITAAVGVLCLLLIFFAAPEERITVVAYVAITLVLSWGLSLVRGAQPAAATRRES